MSLFKSSEERRIEREIKIRQGIRRIEKAIVEQNKFTDEFIRNAQRARQIGDQNQYQFIRQSLKKTATIKRMLERQLLAVKNALLIKRQAEASADFAAAMSTMAKEIGRLFGETDLTQTQLDWEKALLQSQSMEERMSLFLDSVQQMATSEAGPAAVESISDAEIDAMIDAEAQAEHAREMQQLAGLRAELDALKGQVQRESK